MPTGGIPLSASTDLTLASESLKTDDDPIISARSMPKFRELYLGKTDPSNPLASPVFGDYRGIPPLLIQVGEHEMLLDDSIRVAKKAQADGISAKLEVWPGMFHVFQSHEPLLPEAREAIQHIGEFIRSRANVQPSPVAALLDYSVQLDTVTSGFDGKTGWVAARAGIVPGAPPSVVLTMQKLLLSGSDVFFAVHEMRTDDLGKTWSRPLEHKTLGRRQEPGGVEIVVGDFTPKWHAPTGKLLGTGPTVRYQKNAAGADVKISQNNAPSRPAYAVYDPGERTWTPWETVVMPEEPRFF
jgi:hypothetical protein